MTIVRRQSVYHLRLRVPTRYRAVEPRQYVWFSLRTDSRAIAQTKAVRIRAEAIEAWEAQLEGAGAEGASRMRAARELAAKRGYRFLAAQDVAALPVGQLVARLEDSLTPRGDLNPAVADAVLGLARPSQITITAALERYWDLSRHQEFNKSADQIRRWRNPVKKAVANFQEAVGDLPIGEISTKHLFEFRSWWISRLAEKGLKSNSANKDFVHLAKLLRDVARAEEIEVQFSTERLALREKEARVRPPFSTTWIREKLLAPGAMAALNAQARGIVLGMINTGYRPSEGAMLTRAQIRLDCNVPHISIEPVNGRELKTENARRVIPLVGVSLEAFRENPDGFPRYADNPGLSNLVNKFFRNNGLAETPGHTLYSLRHSFEDRMLAAGIDERVRRDVFGHSLGRERYGAGASLDHVAALLRPIAL